MFDFNLKNLNISIPVIIAAAVPIVFISCNGNEDQLNYKPNILFIVVDDLRSDLGCYGNQVVKTPNFDRLSSSGVVFNRAYCNVPVCGASRASVMTGRRPSDYQFLQFYSRADEDYPEALVLPAQFRNNGYHTTSLGKVFHIPQDSEWSWSEKIKIRGKSKQFVLPENISLLEHGIKGRPFEKADVPDSAYIDGAIALRAVERLSKFSKKDEPFFFAVGFIKPHLPFNAPEKYWNLYNPEEIGLPSNPFPPDGAPPEAFHPWKELRTYYSVPKEGDIPKEMALNLRHAYYANISYIDAQLGMILDEMDRSGLSKNTIIVLWGDHGWNLGENSLWGKHCNFNNSLNAPLIFKVPGLTKGGVNSNITEFIDIYPTLCNLSGIEKPNGLEGECLISRLKKPGRKESDYAVCKFGNGVTLIKDKFFYTKWYDKKDRRISDMLYDHSVDPEENVNLSLKPEYSEIVKNLNIELKEKRGENFFR